MEISKSFIYIIYICRFYFYLEKKDKNKTKSLNIFKYKENVMFLGILVFHANKKNFI